MFEKKRRENPEKQKTKTQPNSQPRRPSPLHFSSFPGQPNRPAQTSAAAQLFLSGSWIILIKYYVTGFMVIHQLVVNSFNKILPTLKANAVESANVRASQFVLYLLSKSCVLTLASTTLFPLVLLGTLYCCSVPADTREFTQSYQKHEDFQAFISQSTSLWRPASESYCSCIMLPHTLYQTFVIIVINNIHTRFIISYYVICAVIYCSFCCIYV